MFKKNKWHHACYERGIIALFPSIIISSILIILCTSVSQSFLSFLYRTTIFDEKVQSAVVAHSCVLRVLTKHVQNSYYFGGETISIGGDFCVIETFSTTTGYVSVKVGDVISIEGFVLTS
jgi:hypothetical protein